MGRGYLGEEEPLRRGRRQGRDDLVVEKGETTEGSHKFVTESIDRSSFFLFFLSVWREGRSRKGRRPTYQWT